MYRMTNTNFAFVKILKQPFRHLRVKLVEGEKCWGFLYPTATVKMSVICECDLSTFSVLEVLFFPKIIPSLPFFVSPSALHRWTIPLASRLRGGK